MSILLPLVYCPKAPAFKSKRIDYYVMLNQPNIFWMFWQVCASDSTRCSRPVWIHPA